MFLFPWTSGDSSLVLLLQLHNPVKTQTKNNSKLRTQMTIKCHAVLLLNTTSARDRCGDSWVTERPPWAERDWDLRLRLLRSYRHPEQLPRQMFPATRRVNFSMHYHSHITIHTHHLLKHINHHKSIGITCRNNQVIFFASCCLHWHQS